MLWICPSCGDTWTEDDSPPDLCEECELEPYTSELAMDDGIFGN